MAQGRGGRPSMPADEAERVVDAMRWLLRERYGENQTVLAQAMGVSGSAVGQHLSGKNRPSHENARVIARLCGTTADAIRSGTWRPGEAVGADDAESAIDPRIGEFVRRGQATARAAAMLGPFAGGAGKRTDAELLTALQLAENAIRFAVEPETDDDTPPGKRKGKKR